MAMVLSAKNIKKLNYLKYSILRIIHNRWTISKIIRDNFYIKYSEMSFNKVGVISIQTLMSVVRSKKIVLWFANCDKFEKI